MAGERLFKRRVSDFGNPIPIPFEVSLEEFAAMPLERRKQLIAEADPETRKALRNHFLLAQATAGVPSADAGLFATTLRIGRRIIAS